MLQRKSHIQTPRQKAVADTIRKQAAISSVRQFSQRLSGLEPVNEMSQQIKALMERLKTSEAGR